jgi:hypothetical protein
MKTRGSKGMAAPFFTVALNGSEQSASCLCSFIPGEKGLGTRWIGGWVDPRGSWNSTDKRKSYSYWELNPSHPAHSLLLYQLDYPSFPYLNAYTSLIFFCVYVTWYLTLRENHRFRVLDNRLLRKIC